MDLDKLEQKASMGLLKEAEEYTKISVNEYKECLVDIDDKDVLKEAIAEAFLAGAEPREKRIAELEQQVSKLEKYTRWWIEENICG